MKVQSPEYRATAPALADGTECLASLASRYSGVTVIANGNLDEPENAGALLAGGTTDIVAVGKAALANRNWPHRVQNLPSDDLDQHRFIRVADVKDWELEPCA